jgi:hypothetical protein
MLESKIAVVKKRICSAFSSIRGREAALFIPDQRQRKIRLSCLAGSCTCGCFTLWLLYIAERWYGNGNGMGLLRCFLSCCRVLHMYTRVQLAMGTWQWIPARVHVSLPSCPWYERMNGNYNTLMRAREQFNTCSLFSVASPSS